NNDGTIRAISTGTGNTTISGAIGSAVDAIIQDGPKTLTISGNNAQFAGPATVAAGTLALNSTGSLNVNSVVAVNSGATLSNAASVTIAGLNNGTGGGGTVTGTGTGATNTLTLGGSGEYVFG